MQEIQGLTSTLDVDSFFKLSLIAPTMKSLTMIPLVLSATVPG